MDSIKKYQNYFSKNLGCELKFAKTGVKLVLGKNYKRENWWKNYGLVSITLKCSDINATFPPEFTVFEKVPQYKSKLNKHGTICYWIISIIISGTNHITYGPWIVYNNNFTINKKLNSIMNSHKPNTK